MRHNDTNEFLVVSSLIQDSKACYDNIREYKPLPAGILFALIYEWKRSYGIRQEVKP